MIALLARRLVGTAVVLFAVVSLCFFLSRALPGNPFDEGKAVDPAIAANLLAAYDLDAPLSQQYVDYLAGLLRFELGPSLKLRDYSVSQVLAESLPVSVALGVYALLVALVVGLLAGAIAASHRGSVVDTLVMAAATLGLALPNFVIAGLLILLFVFGLGWLPVAGLGTTAHLLLPAVALGLPFAASIARLFRAGLLEVLGEDWIRTARAKGLSPIAVLVGHATRPALLPVVSFLGPAVAGILTGSLVVERIFAIPGMGSHFVDSALNADYYLASGVVIVYTLMRKIWMVFWLWFLAMGVIAQEPVEFITYNIRMNTEGDGEHAWPFRKDKVVSLFRFHRADIFCVQEALPDQMDDLSEALPEYTAEGVGRDDGIREGEFSAIFYENTKFAKVEGGTFWLSETPDECSFGWDAACRRVCSWVKLNEKLSGESFYVFNTHFDHRGEKARRESASLILRKIKEISGGDEKAPVILCGDFNLPPESAPIEIIGNTLNDAFSISKLPPYGSIATYHGFTYDDPPRQRIDYVFVSDGVTVQRYGALTDSRNRAFYSDHLPVLVTLEF